MTCSIGHISCVIVSFVRHMYITVVKFSPSACARARVRACARARVRACVRPCARAACADDDDEIILGIIALVVVKAE